VKKGAGVQPRPLQELSKYMLVNGEKQIFPTQVHRVRVQRWARPPEGFLKVNCDASLIPGELRGGWGFLIRENDGEVVLNGWGRVNHLLNAF
jgi:hypothetical protein